MNGLWTFDEFERCDVERATQLRDSPPWPELVRLVRDAFAVALQTRTVRFGFDEASRDPTHLRAVVQYPLGRELFDRLFNSRTGYRAQFRLGPDHGLRQNALLLAELSAQLGLCPNMEITARRLSHGFSDKGPMFCTVDQILKSLDPELSKVWICERLVGHAGGTQDLFVSRTGPSLILPDSEPWSSFYPEDADGWLDVKGAFVCPGGPYQLKPPTERAIKLASRGAA